MGAEDASTRWCHYRILPNAVPLLPSLPRIPLWPVRVDEGEVMSCKQGIIILFQKTVSSLGERCTGFRGFLKLYWTGVG